MAHRHRPKRRKPSQQTIKALARVERPDSSDSGLIQLSEGLRVGVGDRKTIIIDTAKIASPSHLYDADYAWVEHRPGRDASLFFAKAHRDAEGKLKSRLQIRYPPEDFVRHFWKNSRTFHENVRRMLSSWPQDETRKGTKPEKWHAEKDHSEWVNFDYMAFSGSQAALDFYHLGPGGVSKYVRGQGTAGLELQAVVRIQMTLAELGYLLDLCQPVVDMINEYLPTQAPELIGDQTVSERAMD
jgi:hypothetical protein